VSEHPPQLVLELALRGEPLGENEWADHLATCTDCARRLGEMRAEDERYRSTPQARMLRARLRDAPPVPTRRPRLWLPVLVPALALAAIAIFWVHSAEREDPFAAKGGGLELTVQRGGSAAPWDGSSVRAGDLLQLGWSSGGKGYLAVLAREGDGTVTTLFPETGDKATAIGAGTHQPLGRSVVADGRSLEIFALFSDDTFALPTLRDAMSRGEPLVFSGKRQMMKIPGTPP
jgi:hypothetical protein